MVVSLFLLEYEIGDEDKAEDDERGIELIPLPCANLQDDIAQDTQADAVGNGIAEHHCYHRDEGGECLTDVGEVEELHGVEHQHADKNQSATRGSSWDEEENGRQEERNKEE